MPAIVTNKLKLNSSNNFSESFTELSADNLYVTIGKSTGWSNDLLPETPLDSPKYRLGVYDDFIGIKKVQTTDVVSVVPRIDWILGATYDAYDDTKEVVGGINPSTGEAYQYYVMTNDYHVYKCISNNNGAVSTETPTGTNVTDNIILSDGYVWKYIYTVSTYDAVNYLSQDWMPVRTLLEDDGSAQWSVQENTVNGTVMEYIVENGGSGYNIVPNIVLTGDGTGAQARAVLTGGVVTSIVVENAGQDYTYIDVTVDASNDGTFVGNDAIVRGIISPPGGHGKDAETELGASYRMIKVEFKGDEDGNLPLGVDYRQICLIMNPLINTQGSYIKLSNINGVFKSGDIVTDSGGATGTVTVNNYYDNEIIVNVTAGTFAVSNTIDNGNGVTATIDGTRIDNIPATTTFIQPAELIKGSGDIIYINNRTKITRFTEQDERVRLVVTF